MARAETATAAGEGRARGEAETADAPAVRGRLAAVETMDPNKLGVLLFLSGEVIFFGLLILVVGSQARLGMAAREPPAASTIC